MIYGLIPVGGKGTRLSLPFPKELLPQKGFNFFNPVINHVVEKMRLAGAERIVFVHGSGVKGGIVDHFSDQIHITQITPGFATVLGDFHRHISPQWDDQILFGLPDSVFEGNPFPRMLEQPGVVCGLFSTDPYTKVDRLSKNNEQTFEVKAPKTEHNQNWFWGVLKFDGKALHRIMAEKMLDDTKEVGVVLNQFSDKQYVRGESYLDLGTWDNYNRYLTFYGDPHAED